MAKTYINLLDEAREILQDTQDPYRYSDTTLLNCLNRGLQETARIRPDAFWATFTTDDVVVPEVTVATLSNVWPIPMQFYLPVVSFVVAWAEVLDDEFTVDGRAAVLIQQFTRSLTAI